MQVLQRLPRQGATSCIRGRSNAACCSITAHPLRCICSISSISLASRMLTGKVVPGNSGRLGMATANTCKAFRPLRLAVEISCLQASFAAGAEPLSSWLSQLRCCMQSKMGRHQGCQV